MGQRDDFTLHMAEQLLRGTKHHAPWRNMQETDPDRARTIARLLVERQGPVNSRGSVSGVSVQGVDRPLGDLRGERIPSWGNSRIRNKPSERGRPRPVEKASGPVPAAGPGNTRRAGLTDRYSHLDCYEFVAAVLEENGIRYYGKNGVGNALIDKARSERKPSNHFLTGEGLTRLLSSDTVTLKVKGDSVQQAWEILEPKLKEGAILSFSSQRAGHTGIVGVRDGRWVFINSSGKLGDRRSYRVKEEDLGEEIRSWLAKAKREKSPLSITLGQVDRDLAAAYRRPESLSVAETRKGRVNLLA